MIGIPLKSWEELLDKIKEHKDHDKMPKKELNIPLHCLLFRGQANEQWELETTLERYLRRKISINNYLEKIKEINSLISTCTGRSWDISDITNKSFIYKKTKTLAFMAYLRQNGFPSPLLDWSRSLYIAAFFAVKSCHKYDKFSIYLHYGDFSTPKEQCKDAKPFILTSEHSLATDRKHYLQQTQYTLCLDGNPQDNDSLSFASHQRLVENSENNNLIRYILPGSEAPKILEILDEMNINDYSLFESEPALMSTLAQRHLADLRAE